VTAGNSRLRGSMGPGAASLNTSH